MRLVDACIGSALVGACGPDAGVAGKGF